MRWIAITILLWLIAAGCSPAVPADEQEIQPKVLYDGDVPYLDPAPAWYLIRGSVSNGAMLQHNASGGADPDLIFHCVFESRRLSVNVPDFARDAGQGTLSISGGGETAYIETRHSNGALSDFSGVTGEDNVPENIEAILSPPSKITVAFGDQTIGPVATIPSDIAQTFVDVCTYERPKSR